MQTRAHSEIERAIVQSVSRERLMEDTRAIARWVRLSGTPQERQAFDYVATVLRRLGVEPALYLGYACISLPESASLRAGGKDLRAITHSMGASTPATGIDLTAFSVGNGDAADYARVDVRGRAVVIEGLASPPKVLAAENAGAAACIFINQDEYVHEMIVSGVWGSPTPENKHLLPHIPVVSVARAEGETLHDLFKEAPALAVHLVTRVHTRWTQIPTLVAQLDGVEEAEKFVLFSGHIDSWHYGAMDNGSANATMLETLRVLLPYRHSLRRSLRLAFWSGHSHGRYAGSTWYADNFWEDLHEHCVAHINIDSVGGQNATVLSEAAAMAEMQPCAAEVIRALTGGEFNGSRFSRAGDQSMQGHGIPSLFMSLSEQPPTSFDPAAEFLRSGARKTGGLGWWWHTTEDTVDKIDPALLVRDAQIYAAVVYRYLALPLLPLDVRAAAEDLLGHLRTWQQKAGSRFDLSATVARAQEVADLAARFQSRLTHDAGKLSVQAVCRLNQVISEVERPLVRVNYVQSEPYAFDQALNEPPVPLLAPIDALLASSPGSDEEHELATLLVRRRNRVQQELKEARRALEAGLSTFEEGHGRSMSHYDQG